MKLLAVETAGDACSCALFCDGVYFERHRFAPRRHAELVLTMVQELLGESGVALSELDALAFGRGPGSFTGVRIAAGVIQGLAFGAGLAVVPVSSLQALAQGALRENGSTRVLTAFDARMGEVYWAAYESDNDGLMNVQIEDCASAPETVPLPAGSGWRGVGEGWGVYAEVLGKRVGDKLGATEPGRLARAVDVASLALAAHARGESLPAGEALPVYVRNEVARKRGR